MKQTRNLLITIAVLLLVLYWMPLTTVNINTDQGTWRVPLGMRYSSSGDHTYIFTGPRSTYSVGKDAENAIHSYPEMQCYGNTYYYDQEHDVSYTGHSEQGQLMTELTYHYENGNTCLGWTVDDEIAWPFGDLQDVDVTKEQAMENDWFVIENGIAQNMWIYNDFSRMVKQGVLCYLRTMIIEGTNVKYIDIQVLEETGYRVLTKENGKVSEQTYRRFSDQEENGVKEVNVYLYGTADEAPVLLFEVKQ